jgi:hypothetical protein
LAKSKWVEHRLAERSISPIPSTDWFSLLMFSPTDIAWLNDVRPIEFLPNDKVTEHDGYKLRKRKTKKTWC